MTIHLAPPPPKFLHDEQVEVHDAPRIHWFGVIRSLKWVSGVQEWYYVVANQIDGETLVRREANLMKV